MRYLLILLFSFLTACGASAPVLKPYKMDIQQGNVVTSKMLLQLKPGMTKSQVKFIMGTPLIVDSFHKDRWDYFYQMRQGGKIIEQRRVILEFEKELLTRVRGDVVPQGTPGAVSGEIPVTRSIAEPAKKADEKGWLDKLKFWEKDEKAPQAKSIDKPIEAPKAVLPEASTPETANPDTAPAGEDTPSVLAIPIGTAPAVEVPKAELPQAETPSVETPKAEAPTVETPSAEASPAEPAKIEAAPAPAPVKAEPAVVPVPAAVEAASPKVEPPKRAPQVPSGKQDDKMIFRMDRTLDMKLLEEETAAPKAPEPVVEQAVKPKKKVDDTPLPPETEPSFFDRMLEKIGF